MTVHQDPSQVVGAIGAVIKFIEIALIAETVEAGFAGVAGCVGDCKSPAVGLAELGTDVEEHVGRVTLPGHHVEYGRLAPAQPAAIEDGPRVQDLNPESQGTIDRLVGELPLVLVSAPALDSLKRGDAHDEIVDKLDGDGEEASVDVSVPLGIDYEILVGGLNVVGVEDDLTEVDVGDFDIVVEGDVPLVVAAADDLGVDVELHWF